MVIFCRGGWSCGRWCVDGHVLHLCVHPLHVAFIGGVNPFLGCLSDVILYLPLDGLGFAACSDVLNVGHNNIHGWGLAAVRGWALGSVVAGLVTLKAGNGCRVAGVTVLSVWERL